jgi:hypothetical protein
MTERRDRIQVHIEGKAYSVVGGEFRDMLAVVKAVNGRRFVGELKVWQLPGTAEEIQDQLDLGGFWLEGGTPIEDKGPDQQASGPASSGDRIRVLVQGHQLAIVGGSFQEMLAAVKNLPGRRFDGESKIWEIPGEAGVIQGLVNAAGFQLEGADKISTAPIPAAEAANFAAGTVAEPPPYEAPEFLDEEEVPPYEPPDWWDDEAMPAPPEPPAGWAEESEVTVPEPDLPVAAGFQMSPVPTEPSTMDPVSGPPDSSRRDQIRIRVGGIPLLITGGSFRQMLEVVKQFPGRRFDGDDKVWDLPGDLGLEAVQQKIKAAGFA